MYLLRSRQSLKDLAVAHSPLLRPKTTASDPQCYAPYEPGASGPSEQISLVLKGGISVLAKMHISISWSLGETGAQSGSFSIVLDEAVYFFAFVDLSLRFACRRTQCSQVLGVNRLG